MRGGKEKAFAERIFRLAVENFAVAVVKSAEIRFQHFFSTLYLADMIGEFLKSAEVLKFCNFALVFLAAGGSLWLRLSCSLALGVFSSPTRAQDHMGEAHGKGAHFKTQYFSNYLNFLKEWSFLKRPLFNNHVNH